MPIQSLSSANTTLAAMLGTKNGQKYNKNKAGHIALTKATVQLNSFHAGHFSIATTLQCVIKCNIKKPAQN